MRDRKRNIENLEGLLRDVQSSFINVNNEAQKLEVDEDGVIESGNLEYEISELDDAINNLEEGFNDTLAMLKDVMEVMEAWIIS